MHKYAFDIRPKDKFNLAGNILEVIDVYETDDVDKLKIVCRPLNGGPGERYPFVMHREWLLTMF